MPAPPLNPLGQPGPGQPQRRCGGADGTTNLPVWERIRPRVVGVEQRQRRFTTEERGSQRPAEGEWLRAGGHGSDLVSHPTPSLPPTPADKDMARAQERPHWRRVLHAPRARRPGPGGEARSKELVEMISCAEFVLFAHADAIFPLFLRAPSPLKYKLLNATKFLFLVLVTLAF